MEWPVTPAASRGGGVSGLDWFGGVFVKREKC